MESLVRRSLGEGDYRDLVRQALAEDRGGGDVTSAATVARGIRARGTILAKGDLVVAGIDVAAEAFRELDPRSSFEVRWGDGSRVQAGEAVAIVHGDAHALLEAERTALNFLQHLCGIATLTAQIRRGCARRHHHPRHPQDDTGNSRAREVRRSLRRRHQSSPAPR